MTGRQKAKVTLEAVKGKQNGKRDSPKVWRSPTQVGLWKKGLLENASPLFDVKRASKTKSIDKVIQNEMV